MSKGVKQLCGVAAGVLASIAIVVQPQTSAKVTRFAPRVLDVEAGTFRGVAIGQSRAAAVRVAGRLPRQPRDGGHEPLDSDFYEDGTPSTWSPPGEGRPSGSLRYRQRSILISRQPQRRVFGFILTDPRSETSEGIGIGDTLADARQVYSGLRCDVVNGGTEYTNFPACRVKIGARRYLGFGQDPVRSIALMTVPFDGVR